MSKQCASRAASFDSRVALQLNVPGSIAILSSANAFLVRAESLACAALLTTWRRLQSQPISILRQGIAVIASSDTAYNCLADSKDANGVFRLATSGVADCWPFSCARISFAAAS